jgi:hypothetical protein
MARTSHESQRSCPCCGGPLTRIARRPADRFLSLFRPVNRYQCIVLECGWQGNLARRRWSPAEHMMPMSTPSGMSPMTTPTGTG